MSKAERALETVIGIGSGVAICVMAFQGVWKVARRALRVRT